MTQFARASLARQLTLIVAALLAVGIVALASVAFGSRGIGADDVLAALLGHSSTADQAAATARLPRTVLGLMAGASLGLAGATMQAVTRNPLADPGILGVLSGASLAVVTGMAFFRLSNPNAQMVIAILGSATVAAFVYAIGSLGRGGATPLKLALAGGATSAAVSSLVSAILLPRLDAMDSFRFWQIGGIGGATWAKIAMAVPLLALGTAICLVMTRGLNALALGDDVATSQGENVLRTRLLSSLGAVLLCGVVTSVCGPIGFVGLVVPHVSRLLIGSDHRWLMPLTALIGAALLLLADVAGRVITPGSELNVGIVTPLLGAPFFIWIVRRQKVREL